MENLYGHKSKLAKMRQLMGNFPVINTRSMDGNLLQGRSRQRHFQMNQNIDTYSPIIKLLLSKSPSSAVENNDSISPVRINMDEETLVVDGVLLTSDSGESSSGNSRHKRPTYRAGEENCLFSYGSKRHVSLLLTFSYDEGVLFSSFLSSPFHDVKLCCRQIYAGNVAPDKSWLPPAVNPQFQLQLSYVHMFWKFNGCISTPFAACSWKRRAGSAVLPFSHEDQP